MIPLYSNHNTASLSHGTNNIHRLGQYRRFIGKRDFYGMKALDIGPPNFIGESLWVCHNTIGDLNYSVTAPSDNYDVITCFEVLNHVLNPLDLATGMYGLLRPGGKLYLATPKQWLIPWYHGRCNFAEYKPNRVKALFEYAGFVTIRYEVHNPWMWWFPLKGIRPIFRFLFNRYQLWEFEKPNTVSDA